MLRGLIISFFFFGETGTALESVGLKDILSFQKTNNTQRELLKSKVEEKYHSSTITYSPWLTDLSSSVEHKSNLMEEFVGRPLIETSSTPWTNRVTQRTPYGLSLQFDYTRELGNPELSGFFQDQRYRGTLSFSLFNDFLGKKTREVTLGQTDYNLQIQGNVQALHCLDVTNKYIDTYSASQKFEVSSVSLKNLKAIYKRVARASRKGAVSRNDKMSMDVDINNLESQLVSAQSRLRDTALDLQNISGFLLKGGLLKPLTDPLNVKLHDEKSENLRHIKLLEEELVLIKKRVAQTDLESGRDISLFAGVEASEFNESVQNLDGTRSFEFVGVQASWRFGDKGLNNRKQQLLALRNLKKSELQNRENTDLLKLKAYKEELVSMRSNLKDLVSMVAVGEKLERNSLNRFKNGNSKYFEFLSARNQINQLRNSVIDIRSLYWKRYIDYLFLSGRYDQLCSGEL